MCTRPHFFPLLALLLLGTFAVTASAHDLWLVPPEKPSQGDMVTILAHSGMDFPLSEHAPDPAGFARRIVIAPGDKPAELVGAGQRDKSGILHFRAAGPGLYLVGVETKPKLLTLEAAAFNEYLVADGLPHIYRLRAREKTLDQPGRERYTKFSKALVEIGQAGVGDPSRVVGLPLEIIPLQSPFALTVGQTLPIRVLFQGKPLQDANLGWDTPGDGEAPSGTVRTNEQGEALIPIARTGLMTIRLTHMTRPKLADYEWESFWATLTFRIPEQNASKTR